MINVSEVYDELEGLVVPLDHSPQLGMAYYRDKLYACRRCQDRLSTLTVAVNRELSLAQQGIRATKATIRALKTGTWDPQEIHARTVELEAFQERADTLRYLLEALDVRRGNLRQAGSDIRLIVRMIEEELKLGAVPPPKPFRETQFGGFSGS